jgi:hypothetical protein
VTLELLKNELYINSIESVLENEGRAPFILTSALDRDEWSDSRHTNISPYKTNEEVEWASEPV